MKKINITVSGGLGRMGSLLIKKTIKDKQLHLSSITEHKALTKNGVKYQKNSIDSLKNSDVIIDFTRPACTSEILKLAIKLQKKVIIGTTGFNKKQQAEINKASKKNCHSSVRKYEPRNKSNAIFVWNFIGKDFERIPNGNT